MFSYRSRNAARSASELFGPQFRGSVLYRPFGVGHLRAITFWPWGMCDAPVDQLRRELEHERSVPASQEMSIKPTLGALLDRAGVMRPEDWQDPCGS